MIAKEEAPVPGKHTRDVAEDPEPGGRSRGGWRTWALVLGVFVIPTPPYAAIPAVASMTLPTGRKAAFSGALVVAAEGVFLLSALVLGREAVRRYRRYLNPRKWLGRSEEG